MDNDFDLDTLGNNNTTAAGIIAGETHGRVVAALTAKIETAEEGGRPYRITEDGAIETVERLLAQPSYRRGLTAFYEALSFSRFVKRFRNASTVIFADALGSSGPRFTAVLDYHEATESHSGAQWDFFRAELPLKHTPTWAAWAAASGQPMEQAAFAQFLEDQDPSTIVEPDAGRLVEIARTLEAKTDVSWQSHIRADNGAHRFAFLETINGSAATAKDGKVEIPAEITLALQPFEGSKPYGVKARLRFRLAQGKVKLWFELVRMQDVLKEAFNDELMKIEGEVNKVGDGKSEQSREDAIRTPIYNGPAPAAQQPKD